MDKRPFGEGPFPVGYVSLQDQWRFIAPIWRIVIAILVAQVIGAAIGVAREIVGPSLFFNLWYGGAYATPVGFVIGVIWHAVSGERPFTRHILAIGLLGAMSVALPLFGWIALDFFRI